MKYGDVLRVRRALLRMNQTLTAKRARISFNRYWRIENDLAEPTADELARIAKALRSTASDLFSEQVSA